MFGFAFFSPLSRESSSFSFASFFLAPPTHVPSPTKKFCTFSGAKRGIQESERRGAALLLRCADFLSLFPCAPGRKSIQSCYSLLVLSPKKAPTYSWTTRASKMQMELGRKRDWTEKGENRRKRRCICCQAWIPKRGKREYL